MGLDITLHKSDVSLITTEVEIVNSIRKSYNEHIIDFKLYFVDPQGEGLGRYTTKGKLAWRS